MQNLQNKLTQLWYAEQLSHKHRFLAGLEKIYTKIARRKRQKIQQLETEIADFYAHKTTAEQLKFANKKIADNLTLLQANRHIQRKIPLIIVGNIAVGGTGKTPVVIAITKFLQQQGLQVAIISRGYGGRPTHSPQEVLNNSNPREVGDEPLLIKQATNALVFVDALRAKALDAAINANADVIISDDGLQHFGIVAQIKYLVIDGVRQFGNSHLLPLGALREELNGVQNSLTAILQNTSLQDSSLKNPSKNRLSVGCTHRQIGKHHRQKQVFQKIQTSSKNRLAVSCTHGQIGKHHRQKQVFQKIQTSSKNRLAFRQVKYQNTNLSEPLNASAFFDFHLTPHQWRNGNGKVQAQMPFAQSETVNALAGIGNPQRFFADLRKQGLTLIEHAKGDHAKLSKLDLQTDNNFAWVLTSKDAVKLASVLSENHWVYEVKASFPQEFYTQLLKEITAIREN